MGKFEDMLASGRAPQVLVRGAAWRNPVRVETPSERVISDKAIRGRVAAHEQNFANEARLAADLKASRRPSRKAESRLEKVGTMSLESYCAIQQTLGDDADVPEARNAAIKAAGGFFPGADV